jgi:hypothetical protein
MFQRTPADPLAGPTVVFPSDRYTEITRTMDETREGMPAVVQLVASATSVIPEKARTACAEASSVPALVHTRVQDVLRQRAAVLSNPSLSPFGRQQAIVPVIDRARKEIDKSLGRLAEARALSLKLKQASSRPSDPVTELRYQEIRRAFATLPREERYSTLRGAAESADKRPDAYESELLTAVLSAPAFVLRSLLPNTDDAFLAELRRAADPERHAAVEWCDFVVDMGERAVALAAHWLDQQRSAYGAPVVNPSRH